MNPVDPIVADRLKRERAQQDLTDIEALSKSQPFNRYFVAELNRIHTESVEQALSAKSPEDREKGRHCALLIREIMDMPAQHRQIHERFLRSPEPTQQRPVQVG